MFVLRNKLEDKADDAKSGGSADDEPTVQPGPGETPDGIPGLRAATVQKDDDTKDDKDDKGDEVKDDDAKAAKDDDKKADDKDDKDDKDEPKGIPKSRLDAVLERARTAEKELREVRAKQAAEPATIPAKADDDDDTLTIAQAEKRIEELDGEIAKAMKNEDSEDPNELAALLREQRELGEGVRDAQMQDYQTEHSARTSEEIQFDRVVDELESQIHQLDPNHELYNEDLVQETITLAQALNGQGRTQSDSMLLAVDYMSGRLGIDKDVVADVKKGTDVEKNVKLAEKLPPDLVGAKGVASDKAGVTKDSGKITDMTPDEFEALTGDEDRLKFLRGDTL